jgi:HPt (histidine-containing phosphotransfer) domain-containing protein
MDRNQIDMLLMVGDDGADSSAFVRELFDLFQRDGTNKLKELDAVCAANDTIGLREIVHFVGGSAGNLGLVHLAGYLRAVEEAIDAGRLRELSRCAAPIRGAFTEACRAFSDEFEI